MLPDLSRLQKIILNHSGISGLNFGIFIFILLGRGMPSIHLSQGSIALDDLEEKVSVQPRLQFSPLISFDLEMRFTTQLVS